MKNLLPVACNTNYVQKNGTFVAIQGEKKDGFLYVLQAITQGATKIVCSKTATELQDIGCPCSTKSTIWKSHPEGLQCPNCQTLFVSTEDPQRELAKLSAQAADWPANKLTMIGITGTNGKTTTTWLIDHILRIAGQKTALIGSLEYHINNAVTPSTLTTPSADFLQNFLKCAVDAGVTHVIMEVSAHGLSQNRVGAIHFDAIGFTNLTQDHLDYYPSMENYFTAKVQLISQLKPLSKAVVNTSDSWGGKFAQLCSNQLIPFNHDHINITTTLNGTSCTLADQTYTSPLIGNFNGSNMAMAILIAQNLNIENHIIHQALQSFNPVPGRMNLYKLKTGAFACIDYAHNPGGMHATLSTLKPLTNNLTVIFGAGGDRDNTKRPQMGTITAEYANTIVLTSDNPRSENPHEIINQIKAGIPPTFFGNIMIDPDRKQAIESAIATSKPGDIIAILGKGAEEYQIIGDQKIPMSDLQNITDWIL